MSDKIIHVTDADFDDKVLGSDTAVLVDFWAEWCGPCRAIAPLLEEAADKYDGQLTIAKVNVDDNQQVAGKFGVRSIPTLLLFKGGQLVDQVVGAVPRAQIDGLIQKGL